MFTVWTEIVIAIVLCLALGALGLAVLRLLLVRPKVLDVVALAFPLGAGIGTWFLFLASWLGVRLSAVSTGLAWGMLLTAAILIRMALPACRGIVRGDDASNRRLPEVPKGHLAGVLLVLIGAAGFAAWLGISRSYSAWDDMAIWAVKGYGIAREGTIWAAGRWGDHGLSYPLNIPLLIATFRIAGDTLPASKLVFPLFYLSLVIGSLRFWLQRGVAAFPAVLGTLWLAATPLLFEHATLGYANLPYTCYLVLGSAEGVQGILGGDARRQILSGMLLGLAAWTRPEGALAVASILVAMAVAARWIWPRRLRLLAWILPAAVLAGGWVIFVGIHATGGQMQQALGEGLQATARGELHPGAFYRILRFMGRQALEFSVWGLLAPACLFFLILRAKRLGARANPDAFLLAVVLVVVTAGVTLQFYLADFLGQLMNYLGNSANRMYMPAAVLAVLLTILLTRDSAGKGSPAAIQMPSSPVAAICLAVKRVESPGCRQ